MSENSEKIFSTGLIVNIVLHVTILFTILANFFMYFIADISSKAINNELKHAVDEAFEPIIKNKDKLTKKINELKTQYNELLKQYQYMQSINTQNSLLSSKINDIKLQIENLTFLGYSLPASSSKPNLSLPNINLNEIAGYFKNISFEYYLKLFSEDNSIRKRVNTQLFDQIKIVNILLILLLVVLVGTLLFAGSITTTELWHIALENIITFIFVGIVEIVFFLNIALKFVPAPPSLIFKSLLSSIKTHI